MGERSAPPTRRPIIWARSVSNGHLGAEDPIFETVRAQIRPWVVGSSDSVTDPMGSLIKKRRKRMRKKKHKKMLRRTRHQRRK